MTGMGIVVEVRVRVCIKDTMQREYNGTPWTAWALAVTRGN